MRTPRVDKNGLRQGAWSAEEDRKLIGYITRYRIWNWSLMPKFAGLSRNGKSCRLRWVNYLDPNIRRGNITEEEEKIIIQLYTKLGSRWSKIAAGLPGRTDNEVKNYWHTHLKKLFKDQAKISIEPLVENPKNKATTEYSYGSNNIKPSASASEASNSQDSNPSMAPYTTCMFSCASIPKDNGEFQELNQVRVDSLETLGDFNSFWGQPDSAGNSYLEDEENEVLVQNWYLEATYGIFNNEYWPHDYYRVIDGMELPSAYSNNKF